jgi:hypothetical protein
MATKYWVGRAASVTQITKVVFSSIVSTNTYSVTINGKTVSAVAASTSLGDLIDALVNAWNSSAEPEHREMVAARREDPTLSGLQLTGTNPGVPSTVTAAATTGTATVTQPAVASGPNFWNVAGNWLGGTLPAAADDIVVRDSSVSILYGLTDTNNYASLKIESSFTGTVGLPDTNAVGYPEYRTTMLTLGTGSAIVVDLGYGVGAFSGRIRLDVQGSNVTYTVSGAGSNFGAAFPFELRNPGAGSTVRVYAGGVLVNSSTTGTVAALDVIQRDTVAAAPQVSIMPEITCTTIEVYGGTLLLEGSATTLIARERAQVTVARSAAVATVKVSSQARINWDSSGGITTKLHVEQAGTIDFGRVGTSKTVAACDLFAGGSLHDPLDNITFTAGVVLQACRISDVTIDLGVGVTING